MPVLSIRRRSGPADLRNGMLTFRVFWRRLSVLKFGTAQSRSISRSKLSTNPVVCRSAMPNNTFIVRQVWIAAALWSGCRPRLPVGAASRIIAGSNQSVGDPRRLFLMLHVMETTSPQAGRVEIEANTGERTIRPIASLIETFMMNGVDPHGWPGRYT